MSSLIVQDPPKKELYGTEQTHQHKKKKASKDDTTQNKRHKPINNKEKSKRFINKGAYRAAEAVMFHSKICHSSQ
jgi:hypothetical protein